MEPENQPLPTATPAANRKEPVPASAELFPAEDPDHGLRWIFLGSEGLRAGWSALVFLLLFIPLVSVIMATMFHFHLIGRRTAELAPGAAFFDEVASLLALIIAVALVGLIEGRRISAYNLTGPHRRQHFLVGLAGGFLALSALVGALAAGGWMRFGPVSLSGVAVFRYGLLWGCVFLMTGCFEEGAFRCYLQFTLTRGINFWWAFGIIATICAVLAVFVRGSASTGVYAAALLGFFPCLALYQKSAARSAFWYAAWVTSTLFGAVHISNARESGVGIFSAAFIGFVFCVSVRVTGSAWWAIGCHAGWDWAETFFFGTADSGLSPRGSYLTSHPAGNPFWSGGSVGPEGSALVLGAILLLLAVVLVYGRLSTQAQTASATLY